MVKVNLVTYSPLLAFPFRANHPSANLVTVELDTGNFLVKDFLM